MARTCFLGSPITLQSSQVICGSMNCSMAILGALKINLGWKHVFRQLVRKLFTLTNVSNTHHVDLEEQVAIFLYIIVTNLSNRKVAEHFQQSGNTISK